MNAIKKAVHKNVFSQIHGVDLKTILADKITSHREIVSKFRKEHGKDNVQTTTVDMLYGGMRGIKALIYETSLVDNNDGIKYRGLSIPECQKLLPKAPGGKQPLPEGVYWLLLTGDVPTSEQVASVSNEWAYRSKLPDHVEKTINSFSKTVHPLAQLSAAVTVLSAESKFNKVYSSGVNKSKYWEYVFEDGMDLIGRVNVIAAKIYNRTFKEDRPVSVVSDKDWSYNLMQMMGFDGEEVADMFRMYLSIHADHEGGNASAHAIHLIGSTLSDPYLAFAGGMNALAGPLHGLANQSSYMWIEKLMKAVGDKPTEDQIKEFVLETLKSGEVIPGYGHAVLRKTDPRYTVFQTFGLEHFPEDPVFKVVLLLNKVIPPILTGLGKVANPWPNVDAISGTVLQHYGVKEMNFYTVFFGLSRAIGTVTSLIWSRALGFPIERPKSLTTKSLMESL